MGNRTITLNLQARVDGMLSGLRKAQGETDKTASKWSKMQASIAKNSDTINAASDGLIKGGAMLAAPAVLATKAYADFDKQMSAVSAATHESAGNMKLLREEAIKVGADTSFSAKEAGQGIEELAKAGVSTKDILGGGLKGSMDLAAAGGLDVGEAAETAASALTQFKLSGSQVPHVADLLAAGAGKAQGSVHDLGAALNQSGLIASQTGLSIEEATGGLSAFASAGLVGSDAGTSFKSMLQRLTPQSKEAANLMKELGLSAYDQQGNFVGLANYAGQLQDKLSGMSQEQRNATMNTLFGSDAVRAASVMYQQGADGIQGWIDKVNDSGYAAETAAKMQDNLAGDLEKLGGSFETVFIKSGSGINDFLRGLVQGAEGVVDAFGKIPAPVLSIGTMVAGLAGASAIAIGGFGKLSTAFLEARDNMRRFAEAYPKTAGVLGKIGKAAGIAGAVLVGLQVGKTIFNDFHKLKAGAEDVTRAINQIDQATNGASGGAKSKSKPEDILGDYFTSKGSKVNTTFWDTSGAVDNIGQAIDRVKPKASDWNKQLDSFMATTVGVNNETASYVDNFKKFDEQLANTASQDGGAAKVSEVFKAMVASAKEGGKDFSDLKPLFGETFATYQKQANDLGVVLSDKSIWNWVLSGNAPEKMKEAAEAAKKAGEETEVTKQILAGVQAPPGLSDVIDKLNAASSAAIGASNSTIAYKQKLSELAKAAEKYKGVGKNQDAFDLDTTKGRAAQTLLNDFATSSMAAADGMAKAGESAGKQVAHLSESREAFIKNAQVMGLNSKAAAQMADDYGLIPDQVFTTSEFKSGDTEQRIRDIVSALNEMPKNEKITIEDDSPEVIAALEALGYKVKNIGDGKIEVTATGIDKTEKQIDKAAKKSRKSTIKTDADTKRAEQQMERTRSKKRTAPPVKTSADKGSEKDQAASAGKSRKAPPVKTSSDGRAGKQIDFESQKARLAKISTAAITGPARSAINGLTGYQGNAIVSVSVAGVGTALAAIGQVRAAARSVSVKKDGGRVVALPKRAGGGRLPATGLGTDQILGVSRRDGQPTAWVDDREWVINRKSSDQFNDTLGAINRGDRQAALASLVRGHADGGVVGELPGLASGGRYRWSTRNVRAWDRSADRASSSLRTQKRQLAAAEKWERAAEKRLDKAKSRNAKARARASLKRAKARVKAESHDVAVADKRRDKRLDSLQKARERRSRLGELEFSTRRDLKRGNIRDNYGPGNFAGVDALFDLAKNTDLSKSSRKHAGALAYKQEKQVKALTAQYNKLGAQLDKARAKRDELLSVRDNVWNAMKGTVDLGSLTGQKDDWGYDKKVTKQGVLAFAAEKAAGAKKLQKKVAALQKAGFHRDFVQQVIDEWTSAGTFTLADALLSMNASERGQLKSSYVDVSKAGKATGQELTETMYKGGLQAADGLAKGLYAQQKKVEKAFTTLAKQGERAFKRALGIKSPSRVMAANGGHVVSGLVKGVDAQKPVAVQAMQDLGTAQADAYRVAVSAPAYRLPASSEVQAYAASQGTAATIDEASIRAIAEAVSRINITSPVVVDRRTSGRIVQDGTRYVKNNA